jgi:dTDP-4-dehydrorhamnose reductase
MFTTKSGQTYRRVLVLGGAGTIGTQVCLEAVNLGLAVISTSTSGVGRHQKFDALTQNLTNLAPDLGDQDIVFILSAETDPNAVFRDPDGTHALNVEAVLRLAAECRVRGAKIVFVSTEFVFDGKQGGYAETDTPSPETLYGRYKVEVETNLLADLTDALVVRTGAVVSPRAGENCLVEKMWETLQNAQVKIAKDNLLTLTPLEDVAANIFKMLRADATGLWHVVLNPPIGRIELADMVCGYSELGLSSNYELCNLNDLPYPERRPPKSWLSGVAATKAFELEYGSLANAVALKVRLLEAS